MQYLVQTFEAVLGLEQVMGAGAGVARIIQWPIDAVKWKGQKMIQVKRVYEEPSESDGLRVLVDRLWPRGLTKKRAAVDEWLKDLAPSTELRKWFAHDPAKWKEFQTRYKRELGEKRDVIKDLKRRSQQVPVTLLYGARDEEHNEAVVLQSVLTRRGR